MGGWANVRRVYRNGRAIRSSARHRLSVSAANRPAADIQKSRRRPEDPASYAFCLYNRLYRLGQRIEVESDYTDTVLAATSGERTGVIIVGGEADLSFSVSVFSKEVEAVVLDGERNLAPIDVSRQGDTVFVKVTAGAIVYLEG